ncbi:monooxygenase, FAD-binding protein [Anopheles sinensis]|uniref:Monooxygenase, FAD-binding protein n=1 Tax=Anopheles sinensis TaxID=74873 RepID=A0A084W331_ANOSI|nr:monooxygenase, FAD-binding protein [Anopheles sinensis]
MQARFLCEPFYRVPGESEPYVDVIRRPQCDDKWTPVKCHEEEGSKRRRNTRLVPWRTHFAARAHELENLARPETRPGSGKRKD